MHPAGILPPVTSHRRWGIAFRNACGAAFVNIPASRSASHASTAALVRRHTRLNNTHTSA